MKSCALGISTVLSDGAEGRGPIRIQEILTRVVSVEGYVRGHEHRKEGHGSVPPQRVFPGRKTHNKKENK